MDKIKVYDLKRKREELEYEKGVENKRSDNVIYHFDVKMRNEI